MEKFTKLTSKQKLYYSLFQKFRKEFYKYQIKDASHQSSITISDSALGKLNYRHKMQRELLISLTQKKLNAINKLESTAGAKEYARLRANFLINKLLN